MNKYRCRDCPVQEECIDQSDTAAGAKAMIRNAFSARTDTISTWGVLQKNCLLQQEDEERERKAKKGSLLVRRLRRARADKDDESEEELAEEAGEQEPAEADPEETGIIPIPKKTSEEEEADPEPDDEADILSTAHLARLKSSSAEMSSPDGQSQLGTRALEPLRVNEATNGDKLEPGWLIVTNSQRQIALPLAGEVVLGRFDPSLDDPLDVDLTYDDRETLSVSRRHARIVVANRRHMIEDLGSSNGVVVNGTRLETGQSHPLVPGDIVALGGVELNYKRMSSDFVMTFSSKAAECRHYLFHTHTGRKIEIAPPNNITLGRLDPSAEFVPTIDLGQDGPVATCVSRRHAIITWRRITPCIRDLESTFGTRVNGQDLAPNQSIGLKPGDHISLGGCVLAYEIEK
jgi:pSer/pThr/pTyr-binding forkhead associated (FHA) protein